MEVPENWVIVINSSRNDYSRDSINLQLNKDGIIDLHRDFLEEEDLSTLFYAADVTILPYTVSSSSGVMFDGFSHALPFLATDLDSFREFSSKGLGITVKRRPDTFVDGLRTLAKEYEKYTISVNNFKENLKWDVIASKYALLYQQVLGTEEKLQVVSNPSSRVSPKSK